MMAEWRLGRSWSEEEIRVRLDAIATAGVNFQGPAEALAATEGWRTYYSESIIAYGRAGPPSAGGAFVRACAAIAQYQFSDPRIVLAHFDETTGLLGRRMLLEMRAVRVLRYLGGVVVGAVREEQDEERTLFGFRYDTLEGHIERGAEWFTLAKRHESGEIRFRIEAAWQPGEFPNWWSRVGFALVGASYQEKWHRRAHAALALLARDPELQQTNRSDRAVAHAAPKVVFKRSEVRNA